MNCEKVQLLLAMRASRPLTGSQAAEVEEHLATCPDCRAVARGLSALDEVLGEWAIPEAPDDLPLRVMTRLAEQERPRTVPWRWRTWLERVAVPAVVATGLLLGFLLGNQLEHVSGTKQETVTTVTQDLEVFSDPQSGSLTEAFEAVTLASTGR